MVVANPPLFFALEKVPRLDDIAVFDKQRFNKLLRLVFGDDARLDVFFIIWVNILIKSSARYGGSVLEDVIDQNREPIRVTAGSADMYLIIFSISEISDSMLLFT